jgi:hypothetical protein
MDEPQIALAPYCERAGAGFWAEPVNALTNLAFLVAALAIAHALHHAGRPWRKTWDLWLLAGLVAAVGVGSFLWHTLATAWSGLADVVAILLFINLFLISFLIRIARLRPLAVAAWFVAFQTVNYVLASAFPPGVMNGSLFYLPTWATLWLMVAYCWKTGSPNKSLMLSAGLAFTASLSLRTLDVALCPAWPLGTHFGWHLLNGLTLYLVTIALIRDIER